MFCKSIISTLLLASSALALTINSAPFTVAAGSSVVITFTADNPSAPVILHLMEGPANNLAIVNTITSDGLGGSYTWVVPTTLVSGSDYAFEIEQGTAVNYWGPISITGGAAAPPPSSSVAASSSAVISSATGSVTSAATGSKSITSAAVSSAMSISTVAKNATTTSTTLKSTHSATTNTTLGAPTASVVPSINMGALTISSPVALILGAFAAMLYL